MTALPFDTLKLAEKLHAGGFSEQQAKTAAAAAAFADAMSGGGLVVKADLRETEIRLEAKVESIKVDLMKWLVPLLLGQAALTAALVKLL